MRPRLRPGDMEAIGSKLDFVGLNVYSRDYVCADDSAQGYRELEQARPRIRTWFSTGWIIGPEVLYWAVRET